MAAMLLGEGNLLLPLDDSVVADTGAVVAVRGEGESFIKALILGIFLGGVLSAPPMDEI